MKNILLLRCLRLKLLIIFSIDFTFIYLLLCPYLDFCLRDQQFLLRPLLFSFQFQFLDRKVPCSNLFLIIQRKLLEIFYAKLLQLFGLEQRDLKFATKNI
jgi:hypothetical protein